ncbi:MAG: PstS family phosphate ABC transporter substrate-binding protein [Rhodobacteraceae bacterium]|nr:PstS family phosphate ABC transporter substrate-binding protein [Paracoccaceae bacterium]
MFTKTLCVTAVALATVTAAAPVWARDQIKIVGSSTVFPFSATVAERFGKSGTFKTPVVESTGSGGGLKLFCAGTGAEYPDIANASRRIKASEVERCASSGINEIVEVKIGYDGIVLANSRAADRFELTLGDIFLALAAEVPNDAGRMVPNPYQTWNDINPDLPAVKIEVLGPPPTSGTRDAFNELALEGGCRMFDTIRALKETDGTAYRKICRSVREDGAYIEAGENDNLIVQKLVANPDALGIFGYSFLEQNADKVQGSVIGGVGPEFELIATGAYPVSRSLYFYVKKAHVDDVPGIREFLAEFTSEDAWGEDGYLVDKGLIPMTEEEREQFRKAAEGLISLSM